MVKLVRSTCASLKGELVRAFKVRKLRLALKHAIISAECEKRNAEFARQAENYFRMNASRIKYHLEDLERQ